MTYRLMQILMLGTTFLLLTVTAVPLQAGLLTLDNSNPIVLIPPSGSIELTFTGTLSGSPGI